MRHVKKPPGRAEGGSRSRRPRLIPADPAERRTVRPLAGLTALLGIALLAINVSGYALLIREVGAAGIAVVSVLLTIVGALYGGADSRLAARGRITFRIRLLFLGAAVSCVVMATAVGFGIGLPVVAITLPLLYEISVVEGEKLVFELASARLDLRQAKRLLGPIGAGRWISYVVFGAVLSLTGGIIPIEGTIIVGAAAFVATALLGTRVARQPSATPVVAAENSDQPAAKFTDLPRTTRRSLWVIGTQIVVLFAVSLVIDFLFFERAEMVLDASQLQRLLGGVGAAEGVLTLVFSLFLSGRLLDRLGVAGALMLPTIVMGVLAAALTVALALGADPWTLGIATALTLSDRVLRNAVARPAIAVLYLPLPTAVATQWRARLEGAVVSVPTGPEAILLGLVLLLSEAPFVLTGILVVLLIVWAALRKVTASSYRDSLRAGLDRRELGADVILDDTFVALLVERLADLDPLRALAAAGLLAEHPETLQQAIEAMVGHPDARVRRVGLGRARASGQPVSGAVLRQVLEDAPDDIAACAMALALALTQGEGWAPAHVREGVAAGDLPCAAAALVRPEDPHGLADLALSQLVTAATSTDTSTRLIVATVVAALPGSVPVSLFRTLIADADPGVAGAAISGVIELDDDEVWALLVGRSGQPALSSAIAHALTHGGEAAVDALMVALDAPSCDHRSSPRLARCLALNPQPRALDSALRLATSPESTIRTSVLEALGSRRPVLDHVQESQLRGALTAQAQRVTQLLGCMAGTAGVLHLALAESVLAQRLALAHAVRALGAEQEGRGIARALARGDSRTLAARIELLEAALPASGRTLVAALEAVIPDPSPPPGAGWPDALPPPDRWVAAVLSLGQTPTMLSTVERVIALHGTEVFGSSPSAVLLDIAEAMEEVELIPGAPLFEAGDTGDRLYLVIEGEVSVVANGVVMDVIGKGQAFGELALLASEPRTATALPSTDCVLLSLDGETFSVLLADRPEIASSVMHYLAQRLRRTTTGNGHSA